VGRLRADIQTETGPPLARRATEQGGVLSHPQLIAFGVGAGAIKYRVRIGELHPMHKGVYAVGHRAVGKKGRLWAAVLACGEGAVVSHRSAAELWAIRPSSRRTVDVTVAQRGRASRHGIDVHRVRHLDPRDVTTIDGIPVTTLARTLLDLAEVVPQNDVERAIERAEQRQIIDLRAIKEVIARNPGRKGRRPLLAALTDSVIEPMTRSDLERTFLKLCRKAGIPKPTVNALIEGYEVDISWSDSPLIVELDSWKYHRTRRSFESDRRRDANLQRAGYRTLRVTDRWLVTDPDGVAKTVLDLR